MPIFPQTVRPNSRPHRRQIKKEKFLSYLPLITIPPLLQSKDAENVPIFRPKTSHKSRIDSVLTARSYLETSKRDETRLREKNVVIRSIREKLSSPTKIIEISTVNVSCIEQFANERRKRKLLMITLVHAYFLSKSKRVVLPYIYSIVRLSSSKILREFQKRYRAKLIRKGRIRRMWSSLVLCMQLPKLWRQFRINQQRDAAKIISTVLLEKLNQLNEMSMVLKQFRKRVKICQSRVRDYMICNKARKLLLVKLWNKLEDDVIVTRYNIKPNRLQIPNDSVFKFRALDTILREARTVHGHLIMEYLNRKKNKQLGYLYVTKIEAKQLLITNNHMDPQILNPKDPRNKMPAFHLLSLLRGPDFTFPTIKSSILAVKEMMAKRLIDLEDKKKETGEDEDLKLMRPGANLRNAHYRQDLRFW